MSEQIPTTDSVRAFYVGGRDEYDPDAVSDEQMYADFEAWLAQVRTDAAREALDGLIEYAEDHKNEALTRNRSDDEVYRWATVFTDAWNYRDTHYPQGGTDGR